MSPIFLAGVFLACSPPLQQSVRALAPPGLTDRITLKDGSVILGEVFNPSDHGKLILILQRSWAGKKIPDRKKAWEELEKPYLQRATRERLARLEAWSQARSVNGVLKENDELLKTINLEIERLRDPDSIRPTRLMMVSLDRREIAKVERSGATNIRMLRLGWRAGLSDVESMEFRDLKAALEGRNLPIHLEEPVEIDDLLSLPIETEPQWRLHRAAREVKSERAGWFIRYGDVVLPDSGTAEAFDLKALGGVSGLSSLGNVNSLVRELTSEESQPARRDPLANRLSALAKTGRIGAVVTMLKTAADLSGVEVTSEFWVHMGPNLESWQPAGRRSVQIQNDQIHPTAIKNIEADPQVKKVFEVLEGLGLGQASSEMKQRALSIGAATQQALSEVRTLANADLDRLATPLGDSKQ